MHCGCTPRRRAASSTGGLASRRWLRFSVCRGKRRTPPPTPGSMRWWPGAAHRVCPQPRSTGASGRTSGSGVRWRLACWTRSLPEEGVEALQSLAGGPLARVGVGRLRLDRAVTATPEFRELGYFADLISEFDDFDTPSADHPSAAQDALRSESSVPDWSQLSTEDRRSELQARLAAILARELRTPASAVQLDQPFPELGLDSMMAMTVLRETQKMVGIDLSANMLFNHPTISSLATYVAGSACTPRRAGGRYRRAGGRLGEQRVG